MPALFAKLIPWGLLARTPEPRTPETAMRSEVRRRILDAVAREPGITVSKLRDRVDLGWGSLYHQLQRLEESGLVVLQQVGRRKLVLPGDKARAPDPVAVAMALLGTGTARRIAQLVAEGAASDVVKLAELTGLSPRAVRYHVHRLVRAGLLESPRAWRRDGLRPTPLLLTVLRRSAEVPPA